MYENRIHSEKNPTPKARIQITKKQSFSIPAKRTKGERHATAYTNRRMGRGTGIAILSIGNTYYLYSDIENNDYKIGNLHEMTSKEDAFTHFNKIAKKMKMIISPVKSSIKNK